ncbi:MAG: LysR family transcriptional regulator [Bdellovibrionales bacterium]
MIDILNIDSDRARAFYYLSLEKSFSRAAEVLGISQPGLSQKISKLEDELGATLVIRTTKSLQLTDLGQKFVQYYKTKMELDRSLLNEVSSQNFEYTGELRLASYSSVVDSVVIPVMSKFLADSKLGFNIRTKEMYELKVGLFSGEVDYIITTEPIKKSGFSNLRIGTEENVHILPRTKNKGLPFLDHDENDTTTFDFFQTVHKKTEFRRSYLDNIHSIIKGVELGIGQAIVSKHLVSSNKEIVQKKYRAKMKTDIYLCFVDRPYYSNLHKTVVRLIKNDFQRYLESL